MRKQYHFQPSKNGFYAWDVEKLVEKTKDFPRVLIRLDQIKELDENFWYQANDKNPTCRSMVKHMKLIQETDFKYPIILSQNGRVMDGMHRVAKALLLDQKEIKAIQFTKDPEPDYIDVQEDDLSY